MPLSNELAQRIHSVRFEDFSPDVIHWAKIGILDTVGVTVIGSNDASTRLVEQTAAAFSTGPSVVFGRDRRVTPLDAALINGTAAHALDFDDCNNTIAGHPSVPILPALFAHADDAGASGRDFLTAYVAGLETECKFSLGVNLHQYVKGWHPTVTVGIFGGTAALCHLMKLDEKQTATALCIAASMAAGLKANLGTMTKPLHVGQSCRNALFAALLARNGFTANPNTFEHKHGYFKVFNGDGNYDADKILPTWGTPFDVVKPGLAIKQYPCCGSTHPALDAMLMLIEQHDLKPDDVAAIESYTHSRRLEHTNRPDPVSTVDAKFSVQYVLARALVARKITAEHFDNDAHRDAGVRAIMRRITVAPYTTEQFPADNHFGAEVRVTLRNGTVVSHKVEQALGRTSAHPLPAERLKAKFEGCVAGIVHAANVEPLYRAIQHFEDLADVRAVTALTGPAAAVRAGLAA